jgi:inorganic pyrophosphatase
LTTKSVRHAILSEIATFDKASGDLRIVIETKGSRNKYDYNPECDCLELATVLPEGMSFPYDFGFVPSTLGDDGDPLDVLVLMDVPVVPGCLIRARLIGRDRS